MQIYFFATFVFWPRGLRNTDTTLAEQKEKELENIFEEIISENFPNLKKIDINIQEAQRASNKLKPNKPTPWHIIIKITKVKEKILKATRETQRVNYKGTPITLSADLSREKLQARRELQDILKVLKGKIFAA